MARTSLWLAAVLVAYGAAASAADDPRIAWRIECKGGADKHGEIVLTFTEHGAEATRISVAIPKGTPENNVARRIRKELRRFLPKDAYTVDIDGGETVMVVASSPARQFEIQLQQNLVPGTEIIVSRDE